MLKDQIAKIVAKPKNLSQKALNTVSTTFETVKTNVTTFGTDAVNNVMGAVEDAAWKVADLAHDRQIKTNR